MRYLTIFSFAVNACLAFLIYSSSSSNSPIDSPIDSPVNSPIDSPVISNIDIWEVTRVSDGDTITVNKAGEERRIRFCGIDAPESKQDGGIDAKEFLKDAIAAGGGKVGLTFVERDRYNRHIAEVWSAPERSDRQLLNSLLIASGHAWHYEQYSDNCPNRSALVASEQSANESGRAIWKQSGAVAPWEYRKRNR